MATKVRFAPSPTGHLHVGGLRTALYNYLYANKVGGKIILRIEDTDQIREVKNSVKNLISTFNKMNIEFDEGPEINESYFQSNRLNIYQKYINILIKSGNAYPCFCSAERLEQIRQNQSNNKQTIKYDRHCLALNSEVSKQKMANESYVIRMKIPSNQEIVFYDLLRDKIAIDSSEMDDQVLIKSDGYPTYHFANVVDDHLMDITHVIRGEEWLSSTPKHVLLYEFFNWDLPKFIHLPLLLNQDKSKLSKRQGDVAVEDYLKKGFLPDAIINYVALLGWHPKNENEFFTLDELKNEFSIKNIQKSGAVFDIKKLEWMNSHYMKIMDLTTIAKLAKPFFINEKIDITNEKKYFLIIDYARQRVNTLTEITAESKMFYDKLSVSPEGLRILNNDDSQKLFQRIVSDISSASDFDGNKFKTILMDAGNELGIKGKDLFHPIRIALYGNPQGPDIPIIFSILGKDETLKRLSKFIKK